MKKLSEKTFIICFLIFIVAVAGLTVLNLNETASFIENRTLAEVPEYTREALFTGDYFSEWETFFTDHAAARNTLIKLNAWTELKLLHLPVVNDIVVTDDCLLTFNKFGRWDTQYLDDGSKKMSDDLQSLSKYIAERGGSFFYVGVPTQISFFSDKYPNYLESASWIFDKTYSIFGKDLSDKNVNYVDMDKKFRDLNYPEKMYAATDHHYSYFGAYETYRQTMEQINEKTGKNLKIYTLEDYTLSELPNRFIGSRERKLYGLSGVEDKFTIGNMKDPIKFTRIDNGTLTNAPICAMPKTASEPVTYEIYMGGDVAETIINTDRPELPNVLIYGDSFTNAIETFMYASFNEMRSLDFRHYTAKSLREYIDEYRPDIVICVRDSNNYLTDTGNGQT